MKHSHPLIRALLALVSIPALLSIAMGQYPPGLERLHKREMPVREEPAEMLPTVFEGRVLTFQGSPAQGAVVVSNAGGKAVTDVDGFFRLEVELPQNAHEVHVTAVQAGGTTGLVASAAISLFHPGGSIPTGTLRLQSGTSCEPSWLPAFGSAAGMNSYVYTLTVYDDGAGGGPSLYAGGTFTSAGGVAASRIAKWDGTAWSPLGSGVSGGSTPGVRALTVYDDGSGSGPSLYAGGSFTTAGGIAVNRIAKWDGSVWSALGSGVSSSVSALTAYDDGSGSGPALYAGGSFTMAGGMVANGIARWDGSAWSALGSGMNAGVGALAVYDDGSGRGPALYAGGNFTSAGGVLANRIAKWDGSVWSPLGSGMNAHVEALTVYDDGSGAGPALYAGGAFTTAGGVAANRTARWDGSSWSPLGSGMEYFVYTLTVHDDGSGDGPALYAGGAFSTAGGVLANRVAKWDGSAWSPLESGVDNLGYVYALTGHPGSSAAGPALYAGGTFTSADGVGTNYIAKWDASSWSPLGNGMNDAIHAMTVYDDGASSEPALYAGGGFTFAGGVAANHIARWGGASWSLLGSGMNGWVYALTVYDDGLGGGPALYAGGSFTTAGGVAANRIAKWDGTAWSPLGSGMNSWVQALTVHDDGSGHGPALYAGGRFTSAGGLNAGFIAKWDGISWSPVGSSGLNGTGVSVLTVYDDGSGNGLALYAGGWFTVIGGVAANRIAKWDGFVWSALGSGMNNWVEGLSVHDDGTSGGPALYAGGGFTSAGGVASNFIARWDGTSWSPLGIGMSGEVHALTVYEDGTGGGPALYAGGYFTSAGDMPANSIAKWDGTAWSSLGSGVDGSVLALTVCGDGSGRGKALHAGGYFAVSPAGDSHIAKWGGCASGEVGVAYCFGDGSGTPCPCGNTGGPGEGCANSSGVGAVLTAGGSSSVGTDDLYFRAMNLLPNQPALLFAGNNAVNNGNGLAFGDGLRCAGGSVARLGIQLPNASGQAAWGPGLAGSGGWTVGDTRRFQTWYRNPTASSCATNFNLSNGYEVIFTR